MERLFSSSLIKLPEDKYLNTVLLTIPLINFLVGIVTDMYAPSLPHIADYFHTSHILVKNTITATLIGLAIGGITLGTMLDILGRKKLLITMLFIFTIASIAAPFCKNIDQLIIIRFIQGLSAASLSIGCRVIAIDTFTDKKLTVAILYASFGFGIGTVIAPFIGGYLQYNFGWHATFYIFALYSFSLLMILLLFIEERFTKSYKYSLKNTITVYLDILTNKKFLSGVVILSIVQLNLMFYPTVGPFIVEDHLHYSAIIYGNTALLVSAGYLISTIINRTLITYLSQKKLMDIGITIQALGVLSGLIFAITSTLNLYTLIITLFIIALSAGFTLGNVMSTTMQTFKDHAGIATSIIFSSMMLLASSGNYAVTLLHITSMWHIFLIFLVFLIIKMTAYLGSFRHTF